MRCAHLCLFRLAFAQFVDMGKHARKPSRSERLRSVAPGVVAATVAVAIFVLTSQAPEVTSAESSFVNRLLVGLFGWIPGLYDPATGLWLGIGIRHWAHAFEFGVLGLFVALAAKRAMEPRVAAPGVLAFAVCAGFSLFDQCHRLFVPGRHFDLFDLAMDALGYGVAIAGVVGVGWWRDRVAECG